MIDDLARIHWKIWEKRSKAIEWDKLFIIFQFLENIRYSPFVLSLSDFQIRSWEIGLGNDLWVSEDSPLEDVGEGKKSDRVGKINLPGMVSIARCWIYKWMPFVWHTMRSHRFGIADFLFFFDYKQRLLLAERWQGSSKGCSETSRKNGSVGGSEVRLGWSLIQILIIFFLSDINHFFLFQVLIIFFLLSYFHNFSMSSSCHFNVSPCWFISISLVGC